MSAKCGARKRDGSGQTCKLPAGWGTDHRGEGRCRKHGGTAGRPPTHGLYSKRLKHELRELVADLEADNPLDMTHELATVRALAIDFINRYEETTAALLAWHASFTDEYRAAEAAAAKAGAPPPDPLTVRSKPHQVLDISDAYRLISEASKIIKRIEDLKASNHITRTDLGRIMQEMGRVVERYVIDEKTLERIRDGWLAIRL